MKNKLKGLAIFLFLISIYLPQESPAQSNTHIDLGLRFQKSFGLYWENGIISQFSFDSIANNKLRLGIGYVSSRLGSAIGNNAIKQDNYQIWLAYYFKKDKKFNPFMSLGSGFFVANYGSDDFDALDQSSLLLSPIAGLEWNTPFELKMNVSLGYNFTSGNGEKGPGTLYPVFAQFNFYYPLK